MAIRNALRDGMRWLVMDMTATSFCDSEFDVVFDKGALDALMASDTDEVRQKAIMMFDDIGRVLAPAGKYICISLAEPFIAAIALQHFVSRGWGITIDAILECAGPHVPFIPFFFTFEKPSGRPAPAVYRPGE